MFLVNYQNNFSFSESFANLQIQRNTGLGGSQYGISTTHHPPQVNRSGSSTRISLQLGPLQVPPHSQYGIGQCKKEQRN